MGKKTKTSSDLLDTNLNEARQSLNWMYRTLLDKAEGTAEHNSSQSHYKRIWAALDELEKWHGVSHQINMQLLYPED